MKYKGLNIQRELQAQDERDYKLGSSDLQDWGNIPVGLRDVYLPKGEVQRTDKADTQGCASRAPLNILEAKLTYLYEMKMEYEDRRWLLEKGYLNVETGKVEFSDAFIEILSGTTEEGNSMKEPLHTIYKKGLIPKSVLPMDKSLSFKEYHDPKRITTSMIELGEEFLERFKINYGKVYRNRFKEFFEKDFLCVAVYAWEYPVNGEYQRVEYGYNHEVAGVKPEYYIFDNYIDEDGDFIKKLASDFDFMAYGYRVVVNKRSVKPRLDIINIFKLCMTKIKGIL